MRSDSAAPPVVPVVDWFPYPAASRDLPNAYLHAGHLFVSPTPCRVSTVLGSCVSVAMFDPSSQIGGLNHFLLPQGPEHSVPSPRFGNVAVRFLIESMLAAGANRNRLQAKLFGGASMLSAFRTTSGHLGEKNVAMARAILQAERVPVVAEDVDGQRGRKLIFHTHDGSAWVRSL